VSTNLHSAWSARFVRALAESGVTDLVISPGSRSTPLCLAAAAEPALRCHTHVDERVAGFFALGLARETRRPVALLCTSGTAGAHWLPAVIEAAQAYHPLVLITADRPWEAYDCAAPQTIDQTDLFGRYVRHRAELGLPDPAPVALRAVSRVAAQCVLRARWPEPGPVHVNARFRKPLEPVDVPAPEPWTADLAALRAPAVFAPSPAPSADAIVALRDAIASTARGVVVCGPTVGGEVFRHAAALARAAGYSLLAEATSGVRFGAGDDVSRCDAFDLCLRAPRFRAANAPSLVIELGAPPTSSSYAAWLAQHPAAARWVIAPHGWPDPAGDAAARVFAGDEFVRAVAGALDARVPDAWARGFVDADAAAWSRVDAELAAEALHEGHVTADLVAALRAGDALVIGNSMPVRDIDTFARGGAARAVHPQRGARGDRDEVQGRRAKRPKHA
jgi:2-succinyl-5-enolpyruvyl-6-hydroxy-3-cyclohexene-1-carboxylate synthase